MINESLSRLGRDKRRKTLLIVLAILGVWMARLANLSAPATYLPQASEQHVISDEDLILKLADFGSRKKQLIVSNLNLTDQETTKFRGTDEPRAGVLLMRGSGWIWTLP